MMEYQLKQEATCVPKENVKGFNVEEYKEEGIIFVGTPYGWIRINLLKQTFAVGEYEG